MSVSSVISARSPSLREPPWQPRRRPSSGRAPTLGRRPPAGQQPTPPGLRRPPSSRPCSASRSCPLHVTRVKGEHRRRRQRREYVLRDPQPLGLAVAERDRVRVVIQVFCPVED